MLGISEGRLREIANQTHESDDTNHAVLSLLDYLLSECKEINPWRPIDDNTPKDRELILVTKEYGKVIGAWFSATNSGWWAANCMRVTPTHYQELPETPL